MLLTFTPNFHFPLRFSMFTFHNFVPPNFHFPHYFTPNFHFPHPDAPPPPPRIDPLNRKSSYFE